MRNKILCSLIYVSRPDHPRRQTFKAHINYVAREINRPNLWDEGAAPWAYTWGGTFRYFLVERHELHGPEVMSASHNLSQKLHKRQECFGLRCLKSSNGVKLHKFTPKMLTIFGDNSQITRPSQIFHSTYPKKAGQPLINLNISSNFNTKCTVFYGWSRFTFNRFFYEVV